MSYDLCFWREQPGRRRDSHEVFKALIEGQQVEGLLPFPVERFLGAVTEAFPSAAREPDDDLLMWEAPDKRSSFQIEWSALHVSIALRSVSKEDGNRLVEIAADCGAPLYDPQVGERFDTWIDA